MAADLPPVGPRSPALRHILLGIRFGLDRAIKRSPQHSRHLLWRLKVPSHVDMEPLSARGAGAHGADCASRERG